MGPQPQGGPQPPYLEEGEAEEEEQHVDDLVDDEAAGEAHHDEHAGTDADPVFGVKIPHQDPQRLQHVPVPAGLCGAGTGLQGGHTGPPVPSTRIPGMLRQAQGPSGWVTPGALT